MSNERIDIESIEARMRLWAIGDVSDEDLALELDYIVPEWKRCYEEIAMLKSRYRSCQESLMDQTNWSVRLVEAIDSGKMSEIKRVRNS